MKCPKCKGNVKTRKPIYSKICTLCGYEWLSSQIIESIKKEVLQALKTLPAKVGAPTRLCADYERDTMQNIVSRYEGLYNIQIEWDPYIGGIEITCLKEEN